MGNADAVVISSLITKVNGKEDLVHIFLTDRRKYQEIVHSDNYKISKYILNYLEEYSASPQKNYVQERLECIKGYEKYLKNEKNRGCKIFCVYGNETFQIRIRYVVVFVGFCSRIFCRIYLSGYSISCPLSFIHAF